MDFNSLKQRLVVHIASMLLNQSVEYQIFASTQNVKLKDFFKEFSFLYNASLSDPSLLSALYEFLAMNQDLVRQAFAQIRWSIFVMEPVLVNANTFGVFPSFASSQIWPNIVSEASAFFGNTVQVVANSQSIVVPHENEDGNGGSLHYNANDHELLGQFMGQFMVENLFASHEQPLVITQPNLSQQALPIFLALYLTLAQGPSFMDQVD